jgi:aspartate ammonia-lyase
MIKKMLFRTETDLLGKKEIPSDALWGIHTARALENFPLSGKPVHGELIKAYGDVKLACAITNFRLDFWKDDHLKAEAIEQACIEMSQGLLNRHIIVDALQGGAGTSTNMNVNEVIANRALQILGHKPGSYDKVSPLNDINLHQSTNDTYPTAVKIAAIRLLRQLEQSLLELQEAFQQKEKEFSHIVKIGRTQLQDAVLTTLGREMGAYAEAFNRDRWRIYKCEERLRVINLGGTAIGTGLGAPREFIFNVTEQLREITSLGLARSENLIDGTQNNDAFVEVAGILKTCSSNLFKISNDLRLMASGPDAGFAEINLPPRQAGSSIMPGKVNPVIPEAVAQAALLTMGYDQVITQACSGGNLELNQFLPVISYALLDSISLLNHACRIFTRNCVSGLTANENVCRSNVENSTATVTAIIVKTGYDNASLIAETAIKEKISIRMAAIKLNFLTDEEFSQLTTPEAVCKTGH